MKATGIVRRVDDLGRIVIPREIRKRLNIAEGQPMELFLDGDNVVYRKYVPYGNYAQIVKNAIEEIVESAEIDNDIDPELKSAAVEKMMDAIKILERTEDAI